MSGMTTVRSRSLGERLDRATASCGGLETLARRVLDVVGSEVPFAFACLATTDPASGLITRAFKSHPLPLDDEGFAAVEYGEPDVNQFADLGGRSVPVGVLSIDTEGHPERCRRMRDFMTPRFGFSDELRVLCLARDATWAALGLYRGADEPPFTRHEADLMGDVSEQIANAVQLTLFAGNAPAPRDTRGAAVLIVDAANHVTDMSAAARERIAELGPWDPDVLPASIAAVATGARAGAQPVRTQVFGRSGRWLTLQAMALDGSTPNRSVVVTVDLAAQADVGQLALTARGLTAREQEVAQLVLQGASTKIIASTLFLSPHTVQDHLKAVFRKLDVTSRREMIARLVLTE